MVRDRLGPPGDLADILQRGGLHIVRRGGRVEVVQLMDVSAHAASLRLHGGFDRWCLVNAVGRDFTTAVHHPRVTRAAIGRPWRSYGRELGDDKLCRLSDDVEYCAGRLSTALAARRLSSPGIPQVKGALSAKAPITISTSSS